jgi:hypothetical protein
MNFGSLLIFLELNKSKNNFLIPRTVSGLRLQPMGHGWLKGWLGLSLVARSGGEVACGALTGSSVAASRWQGVAGELAGATRRAPGKAVRGRAHPSDGVVWRQWRMLWVAAFNGGETAPVGGGNGGTALQCQCERGKVRAASNGDNSGGWKVSP